MVNVFSRSVTYRWPARGTGSMCDELERSGGSLCWGHSGHAAGGGGGARNRASERLRRAVRRLFCDRTKSVSTARISASSSISALSRNDFFLTYACLYRTNG